ncbi:SusC/RagA family TonB-linked outer membrane protein [Cytophagaceae bacterium YF14B1]|uniref:SusC/RagA family TonB-linked outer membrane protein n=1 Tax=Xanthocytophaga flava TaxID=3048013 RepID=A0AAE3QRP9_9BACT|nr:SusC/RagA family TonB-linked outer membrane protein [Xanthocytophaga flavus]MDJ1484242.1 SusC/RagA family TonB-linked outer membrane protein [Xanthocytophaga flavus]
MSTIGTSQKLGNLPDDGHRAISFRFSPLKFLWLLILLLSTTAYAQKTVSGKVTDAADGSGLPGVSVSVKGTTTGTTTDASGSYSLSIPGDNTTLVFSFVGYVTQEIAVGNRSSVTVSLAADVQSLQEVVVIGYGEQRKEDATGAVVALGSKDFNKGVIASPEQLLQGRAAGIQITPSSGEPGGGVNIRIRGTTSVRSGNGPLFVVDGVPLDGGNVSEGGRDFGAGTQPSRNPLNFLNPDDIESMSVLKDASAAAIYGSRGANGVVIITTKKGKAGQESLTFSANASVASALRRYDLLSASEYLPALERAGGNPSAGGVNGGGSTNWQDQIFRTSVSQNYNVSYGGGNNNTRYNFSLGYSDQQGIIKKAGLNRLTGRINASHDLIDDKVILDLQLTTSGLKDVYVPNGGAGAQGNLIAAALQSNPTYPIFDAQGRYYTPNGYNTETGAPSGDYRNPVAMLNLIDDYSNTNRTLGNVSATWKIIKGLSYKINFGIDNSTSERRTSIFRNIPGFNDIPNNSGRATIQNRTRRSQLIEHTLNYNNKVGSGTLDALIGYAYQKFENGGSFVQAQLFQPDADQLFPYANNINGVNNSGSNKAYFAGSDRSQSELQSYFGRVNYTILDKYLLTATLRVDGSSKFGKNNKYGYFPSFAAGWKISQESFMPEGIFDELKLRANWGVTGNQEFPSNITVERYQFDQNNNSTSRDIVPNPNLKWEQTTQWGIGLDYAFMNGRLSGAIDYFNKNTTDLLFEAFYAAPAPARSRWINLPSNVINSGVEFTVAYDVFQGGDGSKFGWNLSYNMTFLHNDVKNFNGFYRTGSIRGSGLSGVNAQRIQSGYPLYGFFLPTFTGYDENGFGTYTDPALSNQYVGSPFPKFTFGLTNNFTYGKWNLSLFFNGSTGFYVYNNTANALFSKGRLRNGQNVTKDAANSAENASNAPFPSTRFLEKGDFVRLTNLTLGYNIPLPQGGYAKSLRVSLTGQNLLLFSGYSGVDPEINTDAAIDGIPSLNIDYTNFPSPRIFTLGVNVGF